MKIRRRLLIILQVVMNEAKISHKIIFFQGRGNALQPERTNGPTYIFIDAFQMLSI